MNLTFMKTGSFRHRTACFKRACFLKLMGSQTAGRSARFSLDGRRDFKQAALFTVLLVALCSAALLPVQIQAEEFEEGHTEEGHTATASAPADFIVEQARAVDHQSILASNSLEEMENGEEVFEDQKPYVPWQVLGAARNGAAFDLQLSYTNPDSRAVVRLAVPSWYKILTPRTTTIELDGQIAALLRRRDQDMVILLSEYGQKQIQAGRELVFDLSLEAWTPDLISSLNIGKNTVIYDPLSQPLPELAEHEIQLAEGIRLQKNAFQYTSQKEASPVLEGKSAEKIAALQRQFPDGKYWNHPVSQVDYSVEQISDSPCSHEYAQQKEYTCNVFDNGAQCAGFAFLCFNKFHGFACNLDSVHAEHRSGNEGIAIGDVIHEEGHFSFVTAIDPDGYTVMEANAKAPCEISHGRRVAKGNVLDYYTPKKAYTIIFDSNGQQGVMESQSVPSQVPAKIDTCDFFAEGSRFAGWVVFNQNRSQILYQNDQNPSQFAYASSRQSAGLLGCSRPAVLDNEQQIEALAAPGETLIFKAVWVSAKE